MDSAGKVIGHLKSRVIEGFTTLMTEAREFVAIREKADKGDAAAKLEYFPKALQFGHFKVDEARKYLAGMKDVPEDKKTEIEGLIVRAEFHEALQPINDLEDKSQENVKKAQAAAGKKLLAMHKAGRIPPSEQDFGAFYSIILIHAEAEKDVAVFESILGLMKEKLGDKISKRWLDQREAALATMKEEKEGKKDEKPEDKKDDKKK